MYMGVGMSDKVEKSNKGTVVVGMSGGVDSSVVACLLQERGYNVVGATMRTWSGGSDAIGDAGRVAEHLGVPHRVVDVCEAFEKEVMEYFVGEYRNGRTPNPCVVCNRRVKWASLLHLASEVGADYVATGHYAKVVRMANGRYSLGQAVTAGKDQTYALYNLQQSQLERAMTPLGEFTKDEVRRLARERGLPVADKKDSQEICFIPDNDYVGFIERRAGTLPPPGYFVNGKGERLGRHEGVVRYTVGQRKGLGLSLGRPGFVTAIRPETNEVVVGDDADVYGDYLQADKLNFMSVADVEGTMEVWAKIRYGHRGAKARVRKVADDLLECRFYEPQRAITPGQALVMYKDGVVVGGGCITGARTPPSAPDRPYNNEIQPI